MDVHGWSFESVCSSIDGQPELLSLSRRLADPYTPGEAQTLPFCVHGATRSLKPCMCGSALVLGVRMHLPEAVYGRNRLTIKHRASGLVFSFTAEEALMHWARESHAHGSRALRVPAARLPSWVSRMSSAREASSVDVDWTFCCSTFSGGCAPEQAAASAALTCLLAYLLTCLLAYLLAYLLLSRGRRLRHTHSQCPPHTVHLPSDAC